MKREALRNENKEKIIENVFNSRKKVPMSAKIYSKPTLKKG